MLLDSTYENLGLVYPSIVCDGLLNHVSVCDKTLDYTFSKLHPNNYLWLTLCHNVRYDSSLKVIPQYKEDVVKKRSSNVNKDRFVYKTDIHVIRYNKTNKEIKKYFTYGAELYDYVLEQRIGMYNGEVVMISNNDFNKKLRAENNELFYRISSNTSSQIVDQVYKDFKSYEKALSSYIKNPEKFKGKPRFPRLKRHKIDIDTLRTKFNLPTNIKKKNKKYYDKIDEIYAIHGIKLYEYLQVKLDFSSQQVRLCDGQVMLPINFDFIKPFKTKEDWLSTPESKLKCMRIIPSRNKFKVEIIYQLLNSPLNLSSGGLMGIDLGVNNYAACVTTNGDAFLINGRGMKSYNKFYNKNLRKKREKLAKGKAYSRGMAALDEKRHFKFKDFLHHVTKFLVQYVVDNNIRFVVVGANKYWKQGGLSNGKQKAKGRGARNFNQTFQQIPYETFISILGYKLRDIGVQLITTEESYTSKCSFFDNEFPQKHKEYKGKRVKRGLFKTGGGMLINADCNGALNILKKVFGELSLTDFDDSIVRAVAAPKMINFNI